MRKNRTIHLFILGAVLFLNLAASSFAASQVTYDSGGRRDPFVPLPGEDKASVSSGYGLKLEGIIYDPGVQSVAILSGLAYHEGEAVGDAKVVKILKDHVVVSVGGEEKTLWIRNEEKTQVL